MKPLTIKLVARLTSKCIQAHENYWRALDSGHKRTIKKWRHELGKRNREAADAGI